MKITCCKTEQSDTDPKFCERFEKFTISQNRTRSALKRFCEFENAWRIKEGKLPRNFGYYTQRAGKTFDSITLWSFVCGKCDNFKIILEYRKKGKSKAIDTQILKCPRADIFQSATEEFWNRARVRNPGPKIFICKHPVAFPKATTETTQAEHWLPLCLGWKDENKKTVFESEAVLVKV